MRDGFNKPAAVAEQDADDMQQRREAFRYGAADPVLCGIGRVRPGHGWRRMLHVS